MASNDWWIVDEEFRGRPPAPRSDNYINKMTFEQLSTAFKGGTDAQSQQQFDERDNVMDASTLYDSSRRLADVQDTYMNIAEGIRLGSEALFSEWQGPSATAALTSTQQMHDRVVEQFRSLSDAPLGENTASGQMYNMAVAVDWARQSARMIARHYLAEADKAGADSHTVDGGLTVVHISDIPEIKRMYAEDLAAVLDILADEYVYRSEVVQVHSVTPKPNDPGLPGVDDEHRIEGPPFSQFTRSTIPPPDILDGLGTRPDGLGGGGLGSPGSGPDLEGFGGGPDGPGSGPGIDGLDGGPNAFDGFGDGSDLGAGGRSFLNDAGPGALDGGGGLAGPSRAGIGAPPAGTLDGGGVVPSLFSERPDGALFDANGNRVDGLSRGPNGSVLDSLGRPIDGLRYDSDGNLVDEDGNLVTPARLQELLDQHNLQQSDIERPTIGGPGLGVTPGGDLDRPTSRFQVPDLGDGGGGANPDNPFSPSRPALPGLGSDGLGGGSGAGSGGGLPGLGSDGLGGGSGAGSGGGLPGLGSDGLGGGLGVGPGSELPGLDGAAAGSGLEDGPSLGFTPPRAGAAGPGVSPFLPPGAVGGPGGVRNPGVGGPGGLGAGGFPMMPGGGRGSGDGSQSSVPLPLSDQAWLTPPGDRDGSPIDGLRPADLGELPGGASRITDTDLPGPGGAGAGSGLEGASPFGLTPPPGSTPGGAGLNPLLPSSNGIAPGGAARPSGGIGSVGPAGTGGYPMTPGGSGSRERDQRSSVPLPLSDSDWAPGDNPYGDGPDGLRPADLGELPGGASRITDTDLPGPGGADLAAGLDSASGPGLAPPPMGGLGASIAGPATGSPGVGGSPGLPGALRGRAPDPSGSGGYPMVPGGTRGRDDESSRSSVPLPLSDDEWQPDTTAHAGHDGLPDHQAPPHRLSTGEVGGHPAAGRNAGHGIDIPGGEIGSAVFNADGVPIPGLVTGHDGTVLNSHGQVVPGYNVTRDGVLRWLADGTDGPEPGPGPAPASPPRPSSVSTPNLRVEATGDGAETPTDDGGSVPAWRRNGTFDPDAFDEVGAHLSNAALNDSSFVLADGPPKPAPPSQPATTEHPPDSGATPRSSANTSPTTMANGTSEGDEPPRPRVVLPADDAIWGSAAGQSTRSDPGVIE